MDCKIGGRLRLDREPEAFPPSLTLPLASVCGVQELKGSDDFVFLHVLGFFYSLENHSEAISARVASWAMMLGGCSCSEYVFHPRVKYVHQANKIRRSQLRTHQSLSHFDHSHSVQLTPLRSRDLPTLHEHGSSACVVTLTIP